MKNIKFPLLLLSLLLLSGTCSSDDDQPNNPINFETLILGSWSYIASTNDGESLELSECDFNSTLVFDGSQVVDSEAYGDDCELFDVTTEDYIIIGNLISFTYEGETYTAEILTLNTTTLTFRETDGQEVWTDTYQRQ